jgi:AraC family transcriptional regulator of adaptative response/methylated-DNA-[protein]-cysteine methyltransferase
MVRLPSIRVMTEAFARKDPAFDGTFFAAVKTTGIFCRPVCQARPARRENLEFFATAQAALAAGFRPCKLCKPLDATHPPALVQRLLELVEQKPGRVSERDLREMGIEPSTARRQFLATFKTTFSQWQRSRRVGDGIRKIRNGENMTTAQLTAGFESSSGFRDAIAKVFPSGDVREDATILTADWVSTPLGPMLAVASESGIVMLDFVDKSGFESAAIRMRRKLENCAIVPGKHRYLSLLKQQLGEYFAGARREFSVPLAPQGTDFERRVWDYLQKIPFGQTRSYGQQARAISKPSASRAVGAANGRNDISILIPCHRVIGASGSLVGYGGGLERKKWLLNHERQVLGAELF